MSDFYVGWQERPPRGVLRRAGHTEFLEFADMLFDSVGISACPTGADRPVDLYIMFLRFVAACQMQR